MLLFAALLAASTAQSGPQASATPARARAQATATIRIVQAEKLSFATIEREDPERLRVTRARLADGGEEAIRVIEFE